MAPQIQPHPFEGEVGTPYCTVCNLPSSNRVHSADKRRTRAVLVLDVPRTMSDQELHERLLQVLEADVRLVLHDVTVLP